MANQFMGINSVARKLKNPFIGVAGVARKITSGFIGVNGVARKCYTGSTTIIKSGTQFVNGVATFDTPVSSFTKAYVTIDVPGANRSIYYANGSCTGKTFVVPWGLEGQDEDNPVNVTITTNGGTSYYSYNYYDGEDLRYVRLDITLTGSTLTAKFTIGYTKDTDYGTRNYTGYASLENADWTVRFIL